ncbi:MAG: PorT family protein [Cytophagales bacterium]|nr:MAG: PorT family protein [Cytophagales bacterium]TAF59474.1 MAG: PorT family protein [Cytophagales bacterium]
MQKIGISCFLMLMLFVGVWQRAAAQDTGFRFGIRLNPLVTTVRVTDQDKNAIKIGQKGRAGIGIGLMATYNFTDKFGIYSGINYVSRGYITKYKSDTSSSANVETRANIAYMEIPVALKMRSSEVIEGLRIRGLVGTSLNVAVGGKTTTKGGPNAGTRAGTKDYIPFVMDVVAGAGVEWTLENVGTLDLGLSYHHALWKAAKTPQDSSPIIKMSYISLDLGYYF